MTVLHAFTCKSKTLELCLPHLKRSVWSRLPSSKCLWSASSMSQHISKRAQLFEKYSCNVSKQIDNSCAGQLRSASSLFPSSRKFATLPLEEEKPQVNEEFRLVYEGPLAKSVKLVKLFSLTTAAASLIGSPVLVMYGKESVSLIGKMFLASTVVLMGVSTTLLLHWISKVYVHKMYFHPQSHTFAAETLSFFARTKVTTFSAEDVVVPQIENAFSTFEANGKKYFIHMELKEAQQILNYVREYNLDSLTPSGVSL